MSKRSPVIGRRLAEVLAYLSARAEEEFWGRVTIHFERGLPTRVEYAGSERWDVPEGGSSAILGSSGGGRTGWGHTAVHVNLSVVEGEEGEVPAGKGGEKKSLTHP